MSAVLRMSGEEAETVFRAVRWTDGKPVCPRCECPTVCECRRTSGAFRFRCKASRKAFSITSGTLFAFDKMPFRNYLAAVAIFCNEIKGKSALALTRDLTVQYNTTFVLAHKLREAMASELKGTRHDRFAVSRIDHSSIYSDSAGVHTNGADGSDTRRDGTTGA